MGAAASSTRPSAIGASIVLHGAIAVAAVLPILHAPSMPPQGSPVAITLVFPAAFETGEGAPSAAPSAEPQELQLTEAQEEPSAAALAAPVPEPADRPTTETTESPPANPDERPPEAPAIVEAPPPPPEPRAAPAPRPPAPPRQAARPDPPARPGIRPVPAGAGGMEAAAPAAASAAAIASSAAMAAATPPSANATTILITAPRYRYPPTPPAYPPRAVEFGLTGTVTVRARVTPDGNTEETRLWRSSGHALLDAAALAAVRRWAFEPAAVEGRRVEAWVEVPVHFRLN